MLKWIEEFVFPLFLSSLVLAILIGGYYSYKLEQRKLDILEKNGCATVLIDKR